MKKVIDGLVYDTETAELIHEWSNGLSAADLAYRSRDLYRTARGNWFVHHAGGPMTDMARQCGSNNVSGSERISPIDANRVPTWLETYDGDHLLEALFPSAVRPA